MDNKGLLEDQEECDPLFVGFKSFEEIKKEQEEFIHQINENNQSLRGTGYVKPSLVEEMNLDPNGDFRYGMYRK